MDKLIKSLKWIDENLLKILVIGALFIVPLYPKFPLTHIGYTYISIRLEDLYMGLVGFFFVVQLLRRKVTLNKKFVILFLCFWAAVFLSYLFATYISHTIIYKQVGLLHSLRRIEYMFVFFVAYTTIKSKKDFYHYLYIISFILLIVSVYGIGQKYFGFPAVQTMNPAFANGLILYLTPEARISSTFGGHYDLAAYLVLFLPVILGLYLRKKNPMFFLIFVIALFALVLTASRISFIAYIVSIVAYLLYIRKFKYLIIVVAITGVCSFASSNLIDRFLKTVQIKQIFVNNTTGAVVVPQNITSKELPAGTTYVQIDKKVDSASTEKNKALLEKEILEGVRRDASRSGVILTSSEEAAMVATLSAKLQPINTVVTDISASNRYNLEWPRAVNAFLKNPVLGTGPSSITEATDNDYLRWIGEFGLLGTLIFVYILYCVVTIIWKGARILIPEEKAILYGFIFGIGALLINASYIDVFEASKVAYCFWILCGIFVGTVLLKETKPSAK